ncbi:sensor histidine kinase [Candidatus Southlakia epibionticum]|uniref:histidine kinase n=1 Tax=Candidatus Southlakia epibionticum TaxID=3043284 RepID=A0ABY8WV12_9BACT|nr:HAMP domain-containing histidine kinase [Candidatus Saccharimonadaceae bacterium ML1]
MQEGRTREPFRLPLAAAAHELKAPLALVRQLSLALETGDYTDTERAVLQQRITLTAERALRLTTDLTRAERLDDGLFKVEPLNPIVLCEEVADELSPLYAAHDRTIGVKPHRRQLLGLANRELLRRILLNFTDNALHYSRDAPVYISAQQRQRGAVIRLGVRDYGPAVPANVWRRLMQNLGRPQPLHNRPASSGLGMVVAHEFAAAMGASIGAVRHRDGATFYVDIMTSTQLRLL